MLILPPFDPSPLPPNLSPKQILMLYLQLLLRRYISHVRWKGLEGIYTQLPWVYGDIYSRSTKHLQALHTCLVYLSCFVFGVTGWAPSTHPIPLTNPPVTILLTTSLFLTRPASPSALFPNEEASSLRTALSTFPSFGPVGLPEPPAAALRSGNAFLLIVLAAPRATSNKPIGAFS